jgi:hypothetical protein
MTVQELIDQLQDLPPDATVLIGSQPSWPFEYALTALVTREEVLAHTKRQRGEDEAGEDTERLTDGAEITDVFLLEGRQLRYAQGDMWGAAKDR